MGTKSSGSRRDLLKFGVTGAVVTALGGVGTAAQGSGSQISTRGKAIPSVMITEKTMGGMPSISNWDDTQPAPRTPTPYTQRSAFVLPASTGHERIVATAGDATLSVADDVNYAAWTYDGSIPGPFYRVRQGVEVPVTVRVEPDCSMAHSVDFHAAELPPDKFYKSLMPGQQMEYSFTPRYPGCYMYHCGTPPALMHIGCGMRGMIIVDPANGYEEKATEIGLIHGEMYLKPHAAGKGVMTTDFDAMLNRANPTHVVFNGYANQYTADNPIIVKAGELIRAFVVNAGPNLLLSFHIVGAIFDAVYMSGNPKNRMEGLQTVDIGPGNGACVEFRLQEPGYYTAVNHSFSTVLGGAAAVIRAV